MTSRTPSLDVPSTILCPAFTEIYEPPSPEELERAQTLVDEIDEDEDDEDERAERRGTKIPDGPIEPIDPNEPQRGTIYQSMKRVAAGKPLSWDALRHYVENPLVTPDLDYAGVIDDMAKLAKSELPYFALHVTAGFRNNAHVRGLCGLIIDFDKADEATVRRELQALNPWAVFPSANHFAGLTKNVFKTKAVIRLSRWVDAATWRHIYKAWILKLAPSADLAMGREAVGSYLPAVGDKAQNRYWFELDETAVLDVDMVLRVIGPPPPIKARALVGLEREPSKIPASLRVGVFQQQIAGIEAAPRSVSTSKEITGEHAMSWLRQVVFAGISCAISIHDQPLIEAVRAQNEKLAPHDRWREDEIVEGLIRADRYSDTIEWGSALPKDAPPLGTEEKIEPAMLVDRIATFAGGLMFVRAGMGTGKTEGAARLCRAHPEWRILWITSRKNAAREAGRRADLDFYRDAGPSSERIAVCIDSLNKWFTELDGRTVRKWDLVVVDELPECLDAIFFRFKRAQPGQLLRNLIGLLQLATTAIAMSADLKRWHITLLASEGRSRPYQIVETPELLSRSVLYLKGGSSECEQAAWDCCLELVPNTRKVVIQAGNKRTLDALHVELTRSRPDLRIFKLTRHTPAFNDFDAIVHDHDVILMNTAGGSALNCWTPIWRQFVILDNNAIVGSATGQLIGRIRVLDEDGLVVVGERVRKGSGLVVDHDQIRGELMLASKNFAWIDLGYYVGDRWIWDNDVAEAKIHLMIDKRTQRNDPSFIHEAHRRGWSVEFVEWQSEADKQAFAQRMRNVRQELRDAERQAIVDAPDISDHEYNEIINKGYDRDPEAEAMIVRHMIQRDIYGDRDPDMPSNEGLNRVEWWGVALRCLNEAKRTPISIDDAEQWRDGEWARQMRRYCLLLTVEHAPDLGHHATEIAEPERHLFDASRAKGEGFEVRLIELLLAESFGVRANAPVARPAKGRRRKDAPTVGAGVDDLVRAVMRVYRSETELVAAAGWADRAPPTEETAIAWLGDGLRRAGIRLLRTGRAASRRYLPAWPSRAHWKATYERMRDAFLRPPTNRSAECAPPEMRHQNQKGIRSCTASIAPAVGAAGGAALA